MATQQFKVSLSKLSKRHLTESVIESNSAEFLAASNNRSLKARGWTFDLDYDVEGKFFHESDADPKAAKTGYIYITRISAVITFDAEGKPVPPRSELEGIARILFNKAGQAPVGAWLLDTLDGAPYKPPSTDGATSDLTEIGYTEVVIPDDFETYFDHLFGLGDHIGIVKSAVEAGIYSRWIHRFHKVLQGPPGCGKSEICRAFKRALGDEAVMEFDATATTAAGAIKELSEKEILPRILIVEEIEKADPKALSFLLGVLDLRGEIRKTTARANIQRDTKLFVIATCNDLDLFNSLMYGALASRFGAPVHFRRPDRDMLARILRREIDKIKGNYDWIVPTLDYADEFQISDPRMVISLALSGRDKWLTGEYVRMLRATSDPAIRN